MRREEHIAFCEKCIHRKMDMKQGLVCKWTEKIADFELACPNYILDPKFASKIGPKETEVKSLPSIPKILRPNLQRAKMAKIFIVLVLFFDLISIGSSYLQYTLLHDYQMGEYISDEMASANDTREQIVAIFYTIATFGSIITFLMWFRRAYYNLNQRKTSDYSDGWAVWSWFVPIITLFRPVQIMNEMWAETTKLIKQYTHDYVSTSKIQISIWWILWLLTGIISQISMRITLRAETISELIDSTILDLICSALGIPLALFTLLVIHSYSQKEEHLLDLESNATIKGSSITS